MSASIQPLWLRSIVYIVFLLALVACRQEQLEQLGSHNDVKVTFFWIGGPDSTAPNSSAVNVWKPDIVEAFGGYDDPDPNRRKGYRPKAFVPNLCTFYVCLPYTDIEGWQKTKANASRLIPWYDSSEHIEGETILFGKWLQISYAQWFDVGPDSTDDWCYVFEYQSPVDAVESGISPAIRDYLGLREFDEVSWKFVDENSVPAGEWFNYRDK